MPIVKVIYIYIYIYIYSYILNIPSRKNPCLASQFRSGVYSTVLYVLVSWSKTWRDSVHQSFGLVNPKMRRRPLSQRTTQASGSVRMLCQRRLARPHLPDVCLLSSPRPAAILPSGGPPQSVLSQWYTLGGVPHYPRLLHKEVDRFWVLVQRCRASRAKPTCFRSHGIGCFIKGFSSVLHGWFMKRVVHPTVTPTSARWLSSLSTCQHWQHLSAVQLHGKSFVCMLFSSFIALRLSVRLLRSSSPGKSSMASATFSHTEFSISSEYLIRARGADQSQNEIRNLSAHALQLHGQLNQGPIK
jgi:hypothetical protein